MITALRELGSRDWKIQQKAERWVVGDGFSWVCGVFNINPNEAREFVRKNYWKVGIAGEDGFEVNLKGRFTL